jgi:hypothetical protein
VLDWIGSLRIREASPLRVELGISRSTKVVGLVVLVLALYAAYFLWPVSRWLAIAPGLLAVLGAVLATLERDIVFDRTAGVMQVQQRVFGLGGRSVVPLFHIRAVVIHARSANGIHSRLPLATNVRYIAHVERRVGGPIFLDESRHCAHLLRIAEAIAEVAEVRLEYDATQATGPS